MTSYNECVRGCTRPLLSRNLVKWRVRSPSKWKFEVLFSLSLSAIRPPQYPQNSERFHTDGWFKNEYGWIFGIRFFIFKNYFKESRQEIRQERARRFHSTSRRISFSWNLLEFRKWGTISQYSSVRYFHKQIITMIGTCNR